MANKFAALLVICIVFVAAVQLPTTNAAAAPAPAPVPDPAPSAAFYTNCLAECVKNCEKSGNGRTICEMRCDTDCFNKDLAGMISIFFFSYGNNVFLNKKIKIIGIFKLV